jgi:putative SOS response-associated peptidase YedK
MCGRFNLITNPEQLAAAFAVDNVPAQLVSRYNIAPSQPVSAVRHNLRGERELTHFQWGLIPSWAKDAKIGYKMINARSETAHEKPSFRSAYKYRRCLVPMTGFYEWQARPEGKQPMHIHFPDYEIFAVAGLWEEWQGLQTCTLLTTTPNETMKPIHNRMPAIIDASDYDLWLDTSAPLPAVQSLLRPYRDDALVTNPVSTYVNKPSNEGAECILPLA